MKRMSVVEATQTVVFCSGSVRNRPGLSHVLRKFWKQGLYSNMGIHKACLGHPSEAVERKRELGLSKACRGHVKTCRCSAGCVTQSPLLLSPSFLSLLFSLSHITSRPMDNRISQMEVAQIRLRAWIPEITRPGVKS